MNGTRRKSRSHVQLEKFHEPDVPSHSFKLKTTGQEIDQHPNDDALTYIESPEVILRRANRQVPKIVRRRGKTGKDQAGVSHSPDTDKFADTEKALVLALKTHEDECPEYRSNIRETKSKGNEDYRHKRLAEEDADTSTSKRAKQSASRKTRRTRRSTRPVFDQVMDYNENEHDSDAKYSSDVKSKDSINEPTHEQMVPKIKLSQKMASKSIPVANEINRKKPLNSSGDKTELETVKETTESKGSAQADIVNNDFCASCGGTGELLCCETCENSFHFSCIEPPVMSVDEIGDDQWSCRTCSSHPIADEKEKSRVQQTFFGPIIMDLSSQNAVAYQLPAQIRKLFANIKTSKFGEYVDEFRKSETITSGQRIQDKSGNVLLCYHCKSSGLKGPLAICGECQTPWHIDCVQPPLESTPLGYWECPLHPGQNIDFPKPVSKPSNTSVALRRQIHNDGIINVIDSDSDMEDTSHLTKDERISAGNFEDEEVTNKIYFPAKPRVLEDGTLIPPHAKAQERGSDRIVYNIPSRAIKLDFLDSVYELKKTPYKETITSDVVLALDVLAKKPEPERDAVRNLMALKLQGPAVSTARAAENLSTLVDASLDDENEIGQIAAIRKLMKEKGKERLLEILKDA